MTYTRVYRYGYTYKYTYNLPSFSILNFIFPLYRLNFVEGARFVYKAENSYPNPSFFNLGSVYRFQGGSVNVDGKRPYNFIFINL